MADAEFWSCSAPASLRVGLCAVVMLYELLLLRGNIGNTVGISGIYCISELADVSLNNSLPRHASDASRLIGLCLHAMSLVSATRMALPGQCALPIAIVRFWLRDHFFQQYRRKPLWPRFLMSHYMQGETTTLSDDDESQAVIGRVLVVDDSKALRDAVRRLLADLPECEICGEAGNGREGIEKALELRPDVILMDVGMPELDGLEATRRIRKQLDTEILVFTQYDSPQAASEAFEAGARGYLPKSRAADLVEALSAVAQHRGYFGSERAAKGSSC